jgi:hypothetical protein
MLEMSLLSVLGAYERSFKKSRNKRNVCFSPRKFQLLCITKEHLNIIGGGPVTFDYFSMEPTTLISFLRFPSTLVPLFQFGFPPAVLFEGVGEFLFRHAFRDVGEVKRGTWGGCHGQADHVKK